MPIELPHPADKVVAEFISEITKVQPDFITGIYLTGSIPLGDYYPKKSDIDFLAVMQKNPGRKLLKQVEHIHLAIERKYGRPKLNGYYVTIDEIKNNRATFPSFFRNRMLAERPLELDKVLWLELKQCCYRIYGSPVAELPVAVNAGDVARQLHQNINSYWTTWIERHSSFRPGYFLLVLFPRLTEWGVLGVARHLYTLATGSITSKSGAGYFCLQVLPPRFHRIVCKAIETRKSDKTELIPSFKRAKETIACMKFMIQEFNRIYAEEKQARN